MVTFILTVLIALSTLENCWPLLIGYQHTPQGFTFLGTVHHPGDYFYYLSQFTQGAYRTITTVDLYTGESLPPTFVGWSNVLLGKLFFFLHMPPVAAYHISVGLLTVLVFAAAYQLCRVFFASKAYAVFSLYLFMLFHAFPLLRDGLPSYGDYWNNFAVPRVRIGAVPHQLIIAIASFFLVRTALLWMQSNTSKKNLVILVVSSIVLGSLQPVLWVLTTGILILSGLVTMKHRYTSTDTHGLLALSTGAIPVLYLSILFRSLPFSQLRLWEATQQTLLIPEHFVSATGPLFLVAIISIPFVLRPFTLQRLFLVLFTITSVGMLVSPIPSYLSISHIRFMSTLTILLLSVIAAIGIHPFITAKNRIVRFGTALCIAALSLYLLPNHLKTIALSSAFHPSNVFEYIPTKDYDFFHSLASMGGQNDIFLVISPYNELFPALSGKRSYNGHHLLTIRASQKDAQASAFFNGAMNESDMRTFLRSNRISWVICTVNMPMHTKYSWASIRAKTENLILYAVQN